MESNFIVKKFISAILLPIPWILLCLILGLILLWFTRQQVWGKIFITLTLFMLLVSVLPFIPNYLLKNLENRYPPFAASLFPQATYVVVLGGGQIFNHDLTASHQLTDHSLSRLIEGIRLYKSMPGTRLLLSGGAVSGLNDSEALTMQKAALSLGVPLQDMVLETTAKDTHEEAVNLQQLLGNKPFILVTSAFHMPRAMAVFENLHMHPIAAPTGYQALPIWNGLRLNEVISPKNTVNMDIVIHEYMGLGWEKLKAAFSTHHSGN
ncbi:MAG TPA: envelope biogenesis factor ElyC [Gammaproteobacteria bacterium]|nr:envelope biogenesis factor ElyC [Gammaproteobacteria bacterium]